MTDKIINEVKKVIKGKDEVIFCVLAAMLAGGHVLLEDIPGVGKTTMAKAFCRAMSLDCRRLQFTMDVMPSDITGFSMYNKQSGKFEFRPGAAVCNIFLADEINRTSPKTQSALLEIMEERTISADGTTMELPKPFCVIATQNPLGYAGTQKLPESQMDRFMICLSMGYPSQKDEIQMVKERLGGAVETEVDKVVSKEQFIAMQKSVGEVFVDDKIISYLVDLADKTRQCPDVKLGLSPRAVISITALAKACAFMRGRNYVIPADVNDMLVPAAHHRLVLTPAAVSEGKTARSVLTDIDKRAGKAAF